MKHYAAPWWLPGGHLQTIWPALYSRRYVHAPAVWRRERWATPDQDFVEVDFCEAANTDQTKPLLVLFHGLEGSSSSHYAQAFADWAQAQQCDIAIPHFRGCSGTLNLGPRAYHSGDHQEIDFFLRKFKQQADALQRPGVVAAGVSLGGNALMRWAGEQGQAAQKVVQAIASICSPLDLTASGKAIGAGFNRQVYTRMFLRTMKPKAMAKLKQHPGLFDAKKLLASKDLYEFDNVFTAPLHGFQNTDDYWLSARIGPQCHERSLCACSQFTGCWESQCLRRFVAAEGRWPCGFCEWCCPRPFKGDARGGWNLVVAAFEMSETHG